MIGRKGDQTTKPGFHLHNAPPLEAVIAKITSIPHRILDENAMIQDYDVDSRLSWMSGRETTREEDMIYSLFGILDVTLPVI